MKVFEKLLHGVMLSMMTLLNQLLKPTFADQSVSSNIFDKKSTVVITRVFA